MEGNPFLLSAAKSKRGFSIHFWIDNIVSIHTPSEGSDGNIWHSDKDTRQIWVCHLVVTSLNLPKSSVGEAIQL
jgi:hypothetical protein